VERNGAFYAQLTVDTPTGGKAVRRTRLEGKDGNPVDTVPAAVKAMAALKVKRDDDALTLTPKRTPTFAEVASAYLAHHDVVHEKSTTTIRSERSCINRLNAAFGDRRLREITPAAINTYKTTRAGQGVSTRAINLELVILRNVMKRAVQDGSIRPEHVPTVTWLKYRAPEQRLLTSADLEKICSVAVETLPRTGRMLADLIQLMAYSGARLSEGLSLRWDDVSFDRGQLTINGKGDKIRRIDFNPQLRAHLDDMRKRHLLDSVHLFPSPRTGERDASVVTLNMAMRKAREAAGMPWFHAHLCRHYFASVCVMGGVDYATVKDWLGHADTKLIDRVYGHLAPGHKQAMAARLAFAPTVLPAVEKEA
jgi:integrase